MLCRLWNVRPENNSCGSLLFEDVLFDMSIFHGEFVAVLDDRLHVFCTNWARNK